MNFLKIILMVRLKKTWKENEKMKKEQTKKSQEVVDEIRKVGKKTDPQGCYTGRDVNAKKEKPVQDQDDL